MSTEAASQLHLSQATIDQFQVDGATVLRQVFRRDEVELLEAGIDENLANPSPRAKIASAADDPGWFIEDFCNWQHNSYYRRFIFETRIAALAAELMQSQTVRFYHDHMLTKEPGTRQRTPWHQDQPYYNIDGRAELQLLDSSRSCQSSLDTRVHRRLTHRPLGSCRAPSWMRKPNGFRKAASPIGRISRQIEINIPSSGGSSSPVTRCVSIC